MQLNMVIARLGKCLNFLYDLVLHLSAFSTFRFLDLLQRVSMHFLLYVLGFVGKVFFILVTRLGKLWVGSFVVMSMC